MEDEEQTTNAMAGTKKDNALSPNGASIKKEQAGVLTGSNDSRVHSRGSSMSLEDDDKRRNGGTSTPNNSSTPKLSRKDSQKTAATGKGTKLFDHLPNATQEAFGHFKAINDCLYGSKHMGSSEHDALDCDCAEEWRKSPLLIVPPLCPVHPIPSRLRLTALGTGDGQNHACGEDSDCINRATKMECVDGDCNCGNGCQNQRFQQKQYANVSVIKTEKKGFGLRADSALQSNDFIFEYIGEVINEATFRRRMHQYDDEGIKHFYFMSLTKHEFVDATKKGNLGRFCNHSCNPNCYVDKWVVGDKLRMGIFAMRNIKAGEELVFNYNVDRYGADPQPCYCGEANCTGFIGGKTQTERATKLPLATIEALGIDDGDNWDTAVAKKPRKKKASEDDEAYVNSVQPRGLEEEGVTKVMAALMQCKEKWIAVKLLARIQAAADERVFHRVVRTHGYQILRTTLNSFLDDCNVVLQILDILYKFPRLTKNKISDSKIETAIEGLASSDHEDVATESKRLLDEWSKLETAYRIPRKKFDPTTAVTANSFEERRGLSRDDESSAKPPEPAANVPIPKGPRSSIPQRNANFFGAPRPRRPPTVGFGLPPGWYRATDQNGQVYYYNRNGVTTWDQPTTPADLTPVVKGPSKAQQSRNALQEIIDSVTKETPRPSASQTPQGGNTPTVHAKPEKWRAYSIEKQMKIYENTVRGCRRPRPRAPAPRATSYVMQLFPHVKVVMDKYSHRLPKEEIKRFAKEVNKKLVASDYKNGRVEDPRKISSKQEKKVRAYVKDFFDRAVEKHHERERRRAKRPDNAVQEPTQDSPTSPVEQYDLSKEEEFEPTGGEAASSTPSSASSGRKRKRQEDEEMRSASVTPSETPSVKRLKEEEPDTPSPPPPPPPPPAEAMDTELAEEERAMREQEEALMRENEEAQRWEEETERKKLEAALVHEKHDGTRDGLCDFPPATKDVAVVNGSLSVNGGSVMDLDHDEQQEQQEAAKDEQSLQQTTELRKEGVVGQ